jgi:2,3-dimethylmalate lyase
MSKASRLRGLLKDNEIIVAPGAYDPLSAKIIESMGFPLVYVGGYASSAAYLGEPDLGLMCFAEVIDNLRRINMAVDTPVIADADDGYGNVINVIRTMRSFEEAGIAGLHIEDQVSPKKCGHLEGKQVVSLDEMVQKIKALVHARTDPDFLIIARTDARAVTGFDDAIRRCHAYAAAGADMLFFEAPRSTKELEVIGKAFKVPVLFNAARTGKSPMITISQARDLGFKVMIYPIELLMACCYSMRDMLSRLEENDGFEFGSDRMLSFKDFNEFIGISRYTQLEQKFSK